MSAELIVFFVLALVAIASALGLIISRNAVYSALYLILNFATNAVNIASEVWLLTAAV